MYGGWCVVVPVVPSCDTVVRGRYLYRTYVLYIDNVEETTGHVIDRSSNSDQSDSSENSQLFFGKRANRRTKKTPVGYFLPQERNSTTTQNHGSHPDSSRVRLEEEESFVTVSSVSPTNSISTTIVFFVYPMLLVGVDPLVDVVVVIERNRSRRRWNKPSWFSLV